MVEHPTRETLVVVVGTQLVVIETLCGNSHCCSDWHRFDRSYCDYDVNICVKCVFCLSFFSVLSAN